MSSRCDGPYAGASAVGALRWPLRAPHRRCPRRRRCRRARGSRPAGGASWGSSGSASGRKIAPTLVACSSGAVEVDVVRHDERQVQRSPRRPARGAARRGRARPGRSAARRATSRTDSQAGRPGAMSGFSVGASKTCATSSMSAAATGARSRTWSPMRTPTRRLPHRRRRTRRRAGCRRRRRRAGRALDPVSGPCGAWSCALQGRSSSPSSTRSSSGSSTLHEPKEVNQRRAEAQAAASVVADASATAAGVGRAPAPRRRRRRRRRRARPVPRAGR